MSFITGMSKMKENGTEFGECKSKSTPIAMVAPELKHNTDNMEITRTCAVIGCDDSKILNSEEFFGFPEDPDQRQIWTNLTGRSNWTPTDYSYICIQHFSVDCFKCDTNGEMVLMAQAVPSLRLPRHVLEVEYIDEDPTDIEEDIERESEEDIDHTTMNGAPSSSKTKPVDADLLKLFTEVQMMQRRAVGLRDKLNYNMKVYNRQTQHLNRLKETIEVKRKLLAQKRKKKARILLSLQEKIKEDTTGLVMAMPQRHTDDLKNFALSIYKYSPQAYVFVRNMLRTMLPSTDVLDNWLKSGFRPKNVLSTNNLIKLNAEQTESELSCKISLR